MIFLRLQACIFWGKKKSQNSSQIFNKPVTAKFTYYA